SCGKTSGNAGAARSCSNGPRNCCGNERAAAPSSRRDTMSRAYRIRVRESLRKVVRAADHVSTQVELLNILPPDQMADLLAAELERRGFARQGGSATRADDGVQVTVELASGTVTVQAAASREINVEAENTGYSPDAKGPAAK